MQSAFQKMGAGLVATVIVGTWVLLLSGGVTEAQEAHNGHGHHRTTQVQKRYMRSVMSCEFPDVMLVDMTGTEVALRPVLNSGGPLLLQFIFTSCPTICPVLSATFSAAQKKLGPDLERVQMVSISIDPEYDTPARLRAYARRFRAGPQWRFLTGKREDIVAVQKAFDTYRDNKMRHEPLTFIRASPGEPWVRFDGLMRATDLVAEYRAIVP